MQQQQLITLNSMATPTKFDALVLQVLAVLCQRVLHARVECSQITTLTAYWQFLIKSVNKTLMPGAACCGSLNSKLKSWLLADKVGVLIDTYAFNTSSQLQIAVPQFLFMVRTWYCVILDAGFSIWAFSVRSIFPSPLWASNQSLHSNQ